MSAYLIADVRAKDAQAFDGYRALAADSMAQYGGRYVARRGAMQIVEVCWAPQAILIVEFDTAEQAAAWYESPEHARALALRADTLDRDMMLVDGVAADSD